MSQSFTAAQAAQKFRATAQGIVTRFTAAQAAQKVGQSPVRA